MSASLQDQIEAEAALPNQEAETYAREYAAWAVGRIVKRRHDPRLSDWDRRFLMSMHLRAEMNRQQLLLSAKQLMVLLRIEDVLEGRRTTSLPLEPPKAPPPPRPYPRPDPTPQDEMDQQVALANRERQLQALRA